MDKIIELKGSILSLTVLKLYNEDIEETKQALAQKVEQAPAFFQGIPVVLEPKVSVQDATYLALLVEFLHQLQMLPIGIRTEDPVMMEQAQYAGLAVFPKESKKRAKKEKKSAEKQRENVDEAPCADEGGLKSAMVVNGAVRSGQQIYAKDRDLIVMGPVNPGAEVVADGHVHVFGKVLGKVFAGASGETQAKIFAKQLNPELVCIAGMYQLNDDIDEQYKNRFIEVALEGDQLAFKNIVD
jgi:septum site-determining protein MinC